jgi:hypothetical protein
VAIHPRNSPFVTDEEFQEFTALLARPEVSALGEGRAHWMETRSIWKEKDNMLRRVLDLEHPDTPIVLDIRGLYRHIFDNWYLQHQIIYNFINIL